MRVTGHYNSDSIREISKENKYYKVCKQFISTLEAKKQHLQFYQLLLNQRNDQYPQLLELCFNH